MQLAERFKNIFEPELLREMEQKAKIMEVKANEVIIEIGDSIKVTPMILSGLIRVSRMDEDRNEILLYYINADESCAMTFTCCMQEYPSEIRAVAEEDAVLLAIPISLMDEWMHKYATWKSFVMKTIRLRFHELLKTIDQIAFQKLDERLIYYLKEKAHVTSSTLLSLSHDQIAHDLASSRVVISRLLKKLEQEKKLILYRNQIKILKDL
ncbi:MAG: Crp/Fnr family transcriptional regulator [Bacteroidota bacterium]